MAHQAVVFQAQGMELFQLQTDEGPCLDAFRTATPVVNADLRDTGSRGTDRSGGYGSLRLGWRSDG
jgi:hypothetical protein